MKITKEPIVCLGALQPNGYCSVRIRVSIKKRVDLYTGITVKPEQWNSRKERVKQGCVVHGLSYSTLNKMIEERLEFVNQYRNDAILRNDETACADDLKQKYAARFMRSEKEQSNDFYYLLEQYIEDSHSNKSWSEPYYNEWKRLCKDLKQFNPNLTFLTLSESFMYSYIQHLSQRMSNEKIKNYIKKIKQFISNAKKDKYIINPTFDDFKPKLEKRKKEVNFLTEEELLRVINLDYSSKPSLERVRDVFVFQCCTSLRFSDIRNLRRDNIRINEKGQYEVRLVTQKTKGEVWFPLSKLATEIYNKYKDNEYEDNKAFYVCTYQDFLKFLGEIGKDAAIEGKTCTTDYRLSKPIKMDRKRSKIGTHDARRTFIVHALNGGATFEKISLFTSHSEVEQMKPYINLTQKGKEDVVSIIDRITMDKEPHKH